MCKIKTGAQITKMNDVQNLVTACILRSKKPYTIPALSRQVIHSCNGCGFTVSDAQIQTLVTATTTALLRSKYLSLNLGHYYPKQLSLNR